MYWQGPVMVAKHFLCTSKDRNVVLTHFIICTYLIQYNFALPGSSFYIIILMFSFFLVNSPKLLLSKPFLSSLDCNINLKRSTMKYLKKDLQKSFKICVFMSLWSPDITEWHHSFLLEVTEHTSVSWNLFNENRIDCVWIREKKRMFFFFFSWFHMKRCEVKVAVSNIGDYLF